MSTRLQVSVSQVSDKGRKSSNQDFHGLCVPQDPLLTTKGIAIAIADGISSSDVSQIASETSVKGFLGDYYCTPEAWSVKTSAYKVLHATNSWLYSQTRQSQFRYEKDKGYVCTFSAMILKSTTAHIFHAGDTRIYRLQGNKLEQLTRDHRLWVSDEKSYLNRALGVDSRIEIDYATVILEVGDVFVLATDGVYEFVRNGFIAETILSSANLDMAAQMIVEEALEQGSSDNLSIQIVRVDTLPRSDAKEMYQRLTQLPFAPALQARMEFDGYKILREIHASSRSHIFLAQDLESKEQVVIKFPSVDLRDDPAYLERFLMEEWISRRLDSPYVLKPGTQFRQKKFFYVATEYIEGKTLAQWMIDNPKPSLEVVRNIVEQIARGLRAFHRLEMLHQDLRPENIMLDASGTVKIIDFGSVRVAGLQEIETPLIQQNMQGTAQYMAPEYFLGENASFRSDQYSLAVITYQMLSGRFPYGTQVAKCKTKSQQRKLSYQSVLADDLEIPAWIDFALRKAVNMEPLKRYDVLSEFIHDLRQPNINFLSKTKPPLMERHPVLFWKSISFILTAVIIGLLAYTQSSA